MPKVINTLSSSGNNPVNTIPDKEFENSKSIRSRKEFEESGIFDEIPEKNSTSTDFAAKIKSIAKNFLGVFGKFILGSVAVSAVGVGVYLLQPIIGGALAVVFGAIALGVPLATLAFLKFTNSKGDEARVVDLRSPEVLFRGKTYDLRKLDGIDSNIKKDLINSLANELAKQQTPNDVCAFLRNVAGQPAAGLIFPQFLGLYAKSHSDELCQKYETHLKNLNLDFEAAPMSLEHGIAAFLVEEFYPREDGERLKNRQKTSPQYEKWFKEKENAVREVMDANIKPPEGMEEMFHNREVLIEFNGKYRSLNESFSPEEQANIKSFFTRCGEKESNLGDILAHLDHINVAGDNMEKETFAQELLTSFLFSEENGLLIPTKAGQAIQDRIDTIAEYLIKNDKVQENISGADLREKAIEIYTHEMYPESPVNHMHPDEKLYMEKNDKFMKQWAAKRERFYDVLNQTMDVYDSAKFEKIRSGQKIGASDSSPTNPMMEFRGRVLDLRNPNSFPRNPELQRELVAEVGKRMDGWKSLSDVLVFSAVVGLNTMGIIVDEIFHEDDQIPITGGKFLKEYNREINEIIRDMIKTAGPQGVNLERLLSDAIDTYISKNYPEFLSSAYAKERNFVRTILVEGIGAALEKSNAAKINKMERNHFRNRNVISISPDRLIRIIKDTQFENSFPHPLNKNELPYGRNARRPIPQLKKSSPLRPPETKPPTENHSGPAENSR